MIPKFRAWDKHLKIIRKVSDIDFQNEEVGFYVDDYDGEDYIPEFEIARDFDEVELMQSTGLKDKNGVEVFEGDILKDERGEIRFVYKVSGGFAINMFDSPRKIKDFFYESLADMQTQSWMQMSCEVIGNIYENKELLEVE